MRKAKPRTAHETSRMHMCVGKGRKRGFEIETTGLKKENLDLRWFKSLSNHERLHWGFVRTLTERIRG